MTQKTNQSPWTFDVRVRERNLRGGSLTEKDLEKHLAGLPDLADQAEPFATAQPALAQPPAAAVAADLADDEDEDEDEDDDVAEAAAPAAAPAPAAPEASEPAAPSGGEGELP
jgi:hypothetical protein